MPVLETKGAISSQGFGQFSRQATAVQAEAIDFDGTNDTLSRTSDLVGNTDGKTFTFSAWVWVDTTGSCQILTAGFVPISFFVSANIFSIYLDSTNGAVRSITMDTNAAQIPTNTFVHILYSADVSNSSLRSLYINDVLVSGVTYTDYSNININWTQTDWSVGGATQRWDGRLSNVFLDYTYRNLSIEANRRLFVTADLKPAAGQAALNPILYLPLSDPTAPGVNAGTGGNFTLNGVVARSGRAPNQYNAPYSALDGTNDFLFRTTMPSGVSSSKQFTLAFTFRRIGAIEKFFTVTSNLVGQQIWFNIELSASSISISGSNSSNTTVIGANGSPTGGFVVGRNYNIIISVDLENTSNRYVFVNGNNVTSSITWSTYTNSQIGFGSTTYWSIASRVNTDWPSGNGTSNANIGALWFNTSYIDLSVPANLAKFVTGTGINAAPADLGASGELPTGTSPLIYLPMYGNNAGRNYGTGGDFTVNSGPYDGARGPNEFWGNRPNFNSSGTLQRSTALSVSDSNKFSLFFYIDPATSVNTTVFTTQAGGSVRFRLFQDVDGFLEITGTDSSGNTLLSATATGWSTTAQYVFLTVDLSNTARRFMYFSNTARSVTWNTYTNGNINFSSDRSSINGQWNGSSYTLRGDGVMSQFYFATEYIDFSQEANRLKFRDAFNNPVDLSAQIQAAAIPTPAIYMRFPPTSFGTNSGTGGDFTVNGTITDGGQL